MKAVVEIVVVDREAKRVAIQGPRGRYALLPVADESVLGKLKVGETLIMTYAEAVAILLGLVAPYVRAQEDIKKAMKADKTGTNPINFSFDARLYNEYQWLNTDEHQNITTFECGQAAGATHRPR